MGNKKEKVALNDELLDKVSGGFEVLVPENPEEKDKILEPPTFPAIGEEPFLPRCQGCGGILINGVCMNTMCDRSPLYEYGNDIVICG